MGHSQRLSPWEHEDMPTFEKLTPHLSGHFPKNPLCSVSDNRAAEPPAHHDPNLRLGGRELVRDQIEQGGLKPSAGTLDAFDIGMFSEKQQTVRR
jgi:hypothetical protein